VAVDKQAACRGRPARKGSFANFVSASDHLGVGPDGLGVVSASGAVAAVGYDGIGVPGLLLNPETDGSLVGGVHVHGQVSRDVEVLSLTGVASMSINTFVNIGLSVLCSGSIPRQGTQSDLWLR